MATLGYAAEINLGHGHEGIAIDPAGNAARDTKTHQTSPFKSWI